MYLDKVHYFEVEFVKVHSVVFTYGIPWFTIYSYIVIL